MTDETPKEPAPISLAMSPQQAMKLAEAVWWKSKLHSPDGLRHLFPGLKRPKPKD